MSIVLFSCNGAYDLNEFKRRGFWHTRTMLNGIKSGDTVIIKYNKATLKKLGHPEGSQPVIMAQAAYPMYYYEKPHENGYRAQLMLENIVITTLDKTPHTQTVLNTNVGMRGQKLIEVIQ